KRNTETVTAHLAIDKMCGDVRCWTSSARHMPSSKVRTMPTIPWMTVNPPTGSEVQVMASRLEVRALRDVPGFFLASLALLRQARNSPGALGITLKADLLRRTFWTLSAWTDKDALSAYATAEPHKS